MSGRLGELTWPEAAALPLRCGLVVPLGSTEQHGPHLPLSTDMDIAVALADATAGLAVVSAPVPFGSSGEHAAFPGTLSVGGSALELWLVELGRSAAASFPWVVFVSAHGGNAAAVGRAERRLRDEGRVVRSFFPEWSGDAHAGCAETSLMLAIAPAEVHLDRAEPGVATSVAELMPQLVAVGVRAVSPNGVLGDPAGATAAEGRKLLRREQQRLLALIDDLRAS